MSLTRSFLKGMGLTEEQVGAIVEAHTDTVNGLMAERDRFKSDLDKANEDLNGLRQAQDGKDWKAEFDRVDKEFKDFKTAQSTKEKLEAKKSLYKELLKDAGVSEKRLDTVMRVTDWESIKIGEDGKIADADNVKESVKTEWADFIPQTQTVGAAVANPPASNPTKMTKEQIFAIPDTVTRQQAMADNIELFQ